MFAPQTLRVDEGSMRRFDYIVVGAGSAGSIVAARLSENRQNSVLLLEAGGKDNSLWLRIPMGYSRCYYNPRVNWMYWTEPEARLKDRRIYVPRGKVQGGSGSINAMIYVRGAPADFDDWAAAGNEGWRYSDVLDWFRKLETHPSGENEYHGGNGPIHVSPMRGQTHAITENFLRACSEQGFQENVDFNGATFEGAGIYDINTRNGVRCSSSSAYLRPALGRPNLTMVRNCRVSRIVAGPDARATGVEVLAGSGKAIFEAAREIIICAGAIDTPKLLQLSGLGDGELLRSLGIPVVRDLPAVGKNLQDHLCVSFYYRSKVPTLNDELAGFSAQARLAMRYFLTRRGPLALSVNQAGGFIRSDSGRESPNIQLYFNPLSYRLPAKPASRLAVEPYPGFLLAFNPCRPSSRGSVTLASPDPEALPLIRPNYLSTDHDEQEAVEGCKVMRRLAASPALKSIIDDELAPTKNAESEIDLLECFRENSGSIYHHCGTAAMGTDPAKSVVDNSLKVHGMKGLRVVDASIFPNITSGNTNAPTMMVAEKAAAMILAETAEAA
jgi:choline dehydrogenase